MSRPRPQLAGKVNRVVGNLRWFDPAKGYGFIDLEEGGSVFVHARALVAGKIDEVAEGTASPSRSRTTDAGGRGPPPSGRREPEGYTRTSVVVSGLPGRQPPPGEQSRSG